MFKVALFQILHPDTYHYEGHVDQKKRIHRFCPQMKSVM